MEGVIRPCYRLKMCPLGTGATRELGQMVGASYLLVSYGPVVDISSSPVKAPVAATLKAAWEVLAVLSRLDTAVFSAPISKR